MCSDTKACASAVVTLLPTLLLYKSRVAHTIYLIIICLSCVHNGAGYYFEVFSRKVRYCQIYEFRFLQTFELLHTFLLPALYT
jgi:hypothetical protein